MATHRHRKFRPRSQPVLTLQVQDYFLRRQFPQFSYHWHKNEGIWRGTLQPRETSPAYRIEIRYQLGSIPEVRVLSPPLEKETPHLYRGGLLCLYWPKEWQWRGSRCLVATTILPWTGLWLLYYELWLDTGKWLGPSSHEDVSSSPAPAIKAA